jgi:hypothetical protein
MVLLCEILKEAFIEIADQYILLARRSSCCSIYSYWACVIESKHLQTRGPHEEFIVVGFTPPRPLVTSSSQPSL